MPRAVSIVALLAGVGGVLLALRWQRRPSVERCEDVVDAVDVVPVRSPFAAHSAMLPYFRGKELVELGTRNGDGMNCFARVTKAAVAVEFEPMYCKRLEVRAKELQAAGVGQYTVACQSFEELVLDADVYTWWLGEGLDERAIRRLTSLQAQGKIRPSAMVYMLFDASTSERKASSYAKYGWLKRIDFDETEGCQAKIASQEPTPTYDGGTRFPKALCKRARGAFLLVGVPLRKLAHKIESRASPAGTSVVRPHQAGAPRLTGAGAACSAIPGFRVLDPYDIRAPMAVAERLVELARGKVFLEIGSRRGDIFECVSQHAASGIVVEASDTYCPWLRRRSASASILGGRREVHCPEFFPASKKSYVAADVYYTWISPNAALKILHTLREGVRNGLVRRDSRFVTICYPASYYAAVKDNPVHLWEGVHLASMASRARILPFHETAHITARITSDGRANADWQDVHGEVAVLEFDLSDARWDSTITLTSTQCKAKVYTPADCPTPPHLVGALLADVAN